MKNLTRKDRALLLFDLNVDMDKLFTEYVVRIGGTVGASPEAESYIESRINEWLTNSFIDFDESALGDAE